MSRILKHLKEDENFELLSVEKMAKEVAVLTPAATDIAELKDECGNLNFVRKDEFAGFVLYKVE